MQDDLIEPAPYMQALPNSFRIEYVEGIPYRATKLGKASLQRLSDLTGGKAGQTVLQTGGLINGTMSGSGSGSGQGHGHGQGTAPKVGVTGSVPLALLLAGGVAQGRGSAPGSRQLISGSGSMPKPSPPLLDVPTASPSMDRLVGGSSVQYGRVGHGPGRGSEQLRPVSGTMRQSSFESVPLGTMAGGRASGSRSSVSMGAGGIGPAGSIPSHTGTGASASPGLQAGTGTETGTVAGIGTKIGGVLFQPYRPDSTPAGVQHGSGSIATHAGHRDDSPAVDNSGDTPSLPSGSGSGSGAVVGAERRRADEGGPSGAGSTTGTADGMSDDQVHASGSAAARVDVSGPSEAISSQEAPATMASASGNTAAVLAARRRVRLADQAMDAAKARLRAETNPLKKKRAQKAVAQREAELATARRELAALGGVMQ